MDVKIKNKMKNFNQFVNETYYPDLTPYEYGGEIPECVNIGWLDEHHNFKKGTVPSGLIEKLKDAPKIAQNLGYHNCPFCEKQSRETMSDNVKMIIGRGVVYCFPDLIRHYITEHHYKPPQEFIDDAMNMKYMTNKEGHDYINGLILRHPECSIMKDIAAAKARYNARKNIEQ